jgi:hypothetical protein
MRHAPDEPEPPAEPPPAPELHVFLGPSLPLGEARTLLPDATWHAPVARGDIAALPRRAGTLAAIIDGVFHQRPSVSVYEIRTLLEAGGEVYGASSMGALRAVDLAPHGMVGVGRIYRDFADGRLEAEDEVALVFEPGTWRPLSLPLVQVRYAVEDRRRAGALREDVARAAVALARGIFYPRRTLGALRRAWSGTVAGPEIDALAALLTDPAHDPKRADALELLGVLRARWESARAR